MKRIHKLILILFLVLMNFSIPKDIMAVETYSLAFVSNDGKASTSINGPYSDSFSISNQPLGSGVTIYYKGNDTKCISSLQLYEKDSNDQLVYIKSYDLDSSSTYYDHIWFQPTEAKRYVLQAQFKRQNEIKVIGQNIVGSINTWETGSVSEKGINTVRSSTNIIDGSDNTIYFQSIPNGFAIGTMDVEHIDELYLTITQYGKTFHDYAMKDETTGEYQYTLKNCHGYAEIKACVEIEPTPNITNIYVDQTLRLNDEHLTSGNYHINKMDDDSIMTFQVEKWMPNFDLDYRFNDLLHYELDLSKAMEVIGYRFYVKKTKDSTPILKASATISDGKETISNSVMKYQKYDEIDDCYVVDETRYHSQNPLFFYNWNYDIYSGEVWECLNQTIFSSKEIKECKNSLHIFDFLDKNADYLYNTYYVFEVDVKKKSNIDLRDSQYQYLNEKTHVFNGGYYFKYGNGVYEMVNSSTAKIQEGALGVLKLQYDPYKVKDEIWIQKSHRWDYARDVFTIFQYDVTLQVKNGQIKINKLENSIVSSVNNQFNESVYKIDAAHELNILYEPNSGYALKKITVNGEELDQTMYKTNYKIDSIQKDYVITVEYLPGYHVKCEVVNGKIIESVENVAEGNAVLVNYQPNEGYVLNSIIVDGVALTSEQLKQYESYYPFTNINQNHEIKVIYEKVYKITTKVTNGTISDSMNTIRVNEQRQIYFEPDKGYYLYSLKVDGEEMIDLYKQTLTKKNDYTFKQITSDHSIEAVFVRKSKITIKKQLFQNEIYLESGVPVFLYHIEGTDFLGKHYSLYRYLCFDGTYDQDIVQKEIIINNLLAGTYTIREIDCARYRCSIVDYTSGITKINENKVKAELYENDLSVVFQNKRKDYHNLDHSCFKINEFKINNE